MKIYERYKISTSSVISWLQETAIDLRIATKKSLHTVSSIVSLIQQLLQFSPIPTIPSEIKESLCLAIKLRKQRASFFEQILPKVKSEKLREENRKHGYFVRILETILEVFPAADAKADSNPIIPPKKSPKKRIFKSESSLLETSNSFSELSVEEVETENESNEQIQGENSGSTLLDELIDSEEDFGYYDNWDESFAAFSFFTECQEIREYVVSLWNDYRENKLSLITASIVTTEAYQRIKRLALELELEFSNLTDYKAMIRAVFFQYGIDDICQDPDFLKFTISDLSGKAVPMEQFFMMNTCYMGKEFFEKVATFGQAPVLKDGYYGYFNEEKVVAIEQERAMIVMALLPDLYCLVQLIKPLTPFGGDALVEDIRPFLQKFSLSPSFIFGLDLSFYIVLASRGKGTLARSLEMFKPVGPELLRQMKKWKATDVKTFKPDASLATIRFQLKNEVTSLEDCVQKFMCGDVLQTIKSRTNHVGYKGPAPYSLFRFNPWYCGAILADLSMWILAAGLSTINIRGSVLAVLHLYNALLLKNHVSRLPFIDRLMKLFGQSMFVGDPPVSEFTKAFNLQLGMKVQSLASSGIKSKKKQKFKSKQDKLEHNEHGRGIDIENFTRFLPKRWRNKSFKGSNEKAIQFMKKTKSKFTDLDLLKANAELEQQTGILGMNPFVIQRLCNKFLKVLPERFPELARKGIYDYEDQLPFVAGTFLIIIDSLDKVNDFGQFQQFIGIIGANSDNSNVEKLELVGQIMEAHFKVAEEKKRDVWFLSNFAQ